MGMSSTRLKSLSTASTARKYVVYAVLRLRTKLPIPRPFRTGSTRVGVRQASSRFTRDDLPLQAGAACIGP